MSFAYAKLNPSPSINAVGVANNLLQIDKSISGWRSLEDVERTIWFIKTAKLAAAIQKQLIPTTKNSAILAALISYGEFLNGNISSDAEENLTSFINENTIPSLQGDLARIFFVLPASTKRSS